MIDCLQRQGVEAGHSTLNAYIGKSASTIRCERSKARSRKDIRVALDAFHYKIWKVDGGHTERETESKRERDRKSFAIK